MSNKDLKDIWQASDNKELVKYDAKTLGADISTELNNFYKKTKTGSWIEIITAIFLIFFFSYQVIVIPFVLSKIGAGIIVLAMFLIIYKFRIVNRKQKETLSLPTREYLLARRDHIQKQMKLINTVLSWYIIPPGTGVLLFLIGTNLKGLLLVGTIVFSLLIYFGVYILNKRAVKRQFKPLLEDLNKVISKINKSENEQNL